MTRNYSPNDNNDDLAVIAVKQVAVSTSTSNTPYRQSFSYDWLGNLLSVTASADERRNIDRHHDEPHDPRHDSGHLRCVIDNSHLRQLHLHRSRRRLEQTVARHSCDQRGQVRNPCRVTKRCLSFVPKGFGLDHSCDALLLLSRQSIVRHILRQLLRGRVCGVHRRHPPECCTDCTHRYFERDDLTSSGTSVSTNVTTTQGSDLLIDYLPAPATPTPTATAQTRPKHTSVIQPTLWQRIGQLQGSGINGRH